MLKAVRTIEDWVLPNLPSPGEDRIKSVLLVDSLLTEEQGGDTIRKGGKTAWVFDQSIEMIPVGKLADIKQMDERTLKFWAGMVLSTKVYMWFNNNCADSLKIFYKMTNSDLPSDARTLYNMNSYYYWRMTDTGERIDRNSDYYFGAELWDYQRMGFLEWADNEWEEDEPNFDDRIRVYRKIPKKILMP